MKLATKNELKTALKIGATALERKLRDGSIPPPVCGIFPSPEFKKPAAQDRPYWDLDACLLAWGRPKE